MNGHWSSPRDMPAYAGEPGRGLHPPPALTDQANRSSQTSSPLIEGTPKRKNLLVTFTEQTAAIAMLRTVSLPSTIGVRSLRVMVAVIVLLCLLTDSKSAVFAPQGSL